VRIRGEKAPGRLRKRKNASILGKKAPADANVGVGGEERRLDRREEV